MFQPCQYVVEFAQRPGGVDGGDTHACFAQILLVGVEAKAGIILPQTVQVMVVGTLLENGRQEISPHLRGYIFIEWNEVARPGVVV